MTGEPNADRHGPARFRHALIRAVIGLAVVLWGVIMDPNRWVASIHGGLLADWKLGYIAPFMLAMGTIVASQSRTWKGTALACLGGLIVAIQCELGTIAAAFVLDDWYAETPQSIFLRSLPALAGVFVALPVMFGTAFLITHRAGFLITGRAGRQKPDPEGTCDGNDGSG